jgi:hypothetical protein
MIEQVSQLLTVDDARLLVLEHSGHHVAAHDQATFQAAALEFISGVGASKLSIITQQKQGT